VTWLSLQVADVYIEGAQITGFLALVKELSYFLAPETEETQVSQRAKCFAADSNTGDASCFLVMFSNR
jgi:hypothetical protein